MRSILAILVVGTFMIITAAMALYPLFFPQTGVGLAPYSDYFAKTASVYTGIVGVVVGYYFGRSVKRAGETTGGDTSAIEARPSPPPMPR